MDPIDQNNASASSITGTTQPINPSMPPIQEPAKPATTVEKPAVPLETEVNQFTSAEAQTATETAPAGGNATPAVTSPTQLPPTEPETSFNAVPAPEVLTAPESETSPIINQASAPVETSPAESEAPTLAEPVNPPPVEPVMPQFDTTTAQNTTPAAESSPMAEPAPPAVESQASAPAPQQAPPQIDQVGTLDQAQINQSQTSAPLQTPPVAKKSKTGLIIVIIVIIVAIGAGAYYYVTKIMGNSSTSTPDSSTEVIEETTPTPEDAATTAGGDIATAYEKAVAISATSDQSKAVDTILAPILNKTFSSKVKLTDATTMLTYLVDRAITAADVTSVKTELETLGYKSADSTQKQLTMTKTGSTWVISFSVDSQTKAQIDVTY